MSASLPTIQITSPPAGSTVISDGTVQVRGSATPGSAAIQAVDVRIGAQSYRPATQFGGSWSTWEIFYDINAIGSVEIVARVTDVNGQQAWATVQVTIQAGDVDFVVPTVTVANPTEGQTITRKPNETVTANGTASDIGSGLKEVQCYIGGGYTKASPQGPAGNPWSQWSWISPPLPPHLGPDLFVARSEDNQGNQAWARVNIILNVQETPQQSNLTVTISSPASGANLQGDKVSVLGSSTPNTGQLVTSVQVQIHPVGGSPDPSKWVNAVPTQSNFAQWSAVLDVPADGQYVIAARASDSGGSQVTQNVSVSVGTAVPPPTNGGGFLGIPGNIWIWIGIAVGAVGVGGAVATGYRKPRRRAATESIKL